MQQDQDLEKQFLALSAAKNKGGSTMSGSSDKDAIAAMWEAELGGGAPAVPPQGPEEPHSLMGFLKNIPTSAGRAIQGATSLFDPNTYANMYHAGRGMIQKAAPESFGFSQDDVPAFDAVKQGMADRYGHPLETMYHDPVGSLIDLSALATGGGAALRGGSRVAASMGRELPSVANAGRIAGEVGEAMNPLTYAAKAGNVVANAAGRTAMVGMGLMTGRGKATGELWDVQNNRVSRTRVDPSQGVNLPGGMQTSTAAMRGKISEMDTVENMKTAAEMAKLKRIGEYQSDLSNWQRQHGDTSLLQQFNRVKDNFYRKLEEDFRIRPSVAGESPDAYLLRNPGVPTAARGTPEYDAQNRAFQQWQQEGVNLGNASQGSQPRLEFAGSGISPQSEAGAKILEMDKLFQEWQQKYPNPNAMDMDLLKRSIDAMYSQDSRARQIVQVTKGDIRKELEQTIPGYKKMTQRYHDASNFIEQLEAEFSLANPNPGVATRKLQLALNQSNDFRKSLLKDLNEIEPGLGDRMTAEVAGHHFSSWMPKGLIGQLGGLGMAGKIMMNPADPTNALIALTSPRVVGEGLTAIGGAKIPQAVQSFMKAPSYAPANMAARAVNNGRGYEPRIMDLSQKPTDAPGPVPAPTIQPQIFTNPKTGERIYWDGSAWVKANK